VAAAAPLPVLLPRASRSRRATGASTVEEADFTNSPCSLSFGEHGLAVDAELFGEFVYAGFAWHGSPHW
jgi:hypothetical protein